MGSKKDILKAWKNSARPFAGLLFKDEHAHKLSFSQVTVLMSFFDKVPSIYTQEIKTIQQALDIYRASIEHPGFLDWITGDKDALDEFHRIVSTPDRAGRMEDRINRLAMRCIMVDGPVTSGEFKAVGLELKDVLASV